MVQQRFQNCEEKCHIAAQLYLPHGKWQPSKVLEVWRRRLRRMKRTSSRLPYFRSRAHRILWQLRRRNRESFRQAVFVVEKFVRIRMRTRKHFCSLLTKLNEFCKHSVTFAATTE